MSTTHTQGQYSNSNELIKDRSNYWPGHITAECLMDENEQEVNDSLPSDTSNFNKTSKNNSLKNDSKSQNKELSKTFKLLAKLKPGSPFSAIISSMVPYEILCQQIKSKSSLNERDFVYDEFGFKIDKENEEINEDSEDICWSKIDKRLPKHRLFIEDSKHKLKWIAYLEFTLNADIGSNFSWDQVVSLNKCEKMKLMIRGQGIPHSLRPFVN